MSREPQQSVPLDDAPTVDAPEESPRSAPSLSELRDAVSGGLGAAAEAMLGAKARAVLTAVDQSDTRTFVSSVVEPSCAFRLPVTAAGAAADAPPKAWIELPVRLAGSIVDRLLGGSGDQAPDDRPLTRAERRLLRRFVERWTEPVAAALERAGVSVASGAPAAVLAFEACVGAAAGTVKLCLPAGVLGRQGAAAEDASSGPVEISVAVEQPAEADALANLEPGDIIDTEMPVDGEVIVRVAGIPKYAGRLRACDGRRAVEIVRRLGEPPADRHPAQAQGDPEDGGAS